jgi:hypothetical protein
LLIAALLNAIIPIPSLAAITAAFPRLARHLREPRRLRQYQPIRRLS